MNHNNILLNISLFICMFLLGLFCGHEYNDYQEDTLKEDIYNMINEVNFEVRKFRKCSDNATLKKSNGMSMFFYSWDDGYHYSEPVKYSEIKIGDVITFNKNNRTIHHAVINKYNDFLVTAGYGNNKADNFKVYPDDVIDRDCFMIK